MALKNKRQLSRVSTVYIALGVLLITLMAIVGMSAFMQAREIIVEGASVYSIEEIVEASGLSPGNNLLFVNTQNVSQNIRDALPFVSAAQVTRELPDTVRIEVTESRAVARIVHAGSELVIDAAGRVLAVEDAEIAVSGVTQGSAISTNLIEVRGVEIDNYTLGSVLKPVFGTDTKLQYMLDVLSALEHDELVNDVSLLDVSNIVNVYFELLGKYRVVLGGATNLRPANLRHHIGGLMDNVARIEGTFPNVSGSIIFDESGPPRFVPDG